MTSTAERRLLDSVTELCARDGFASLTVERVLAAAEVSRATFYQYFSSVEDCFLSAYRAHALELVERIASVPPGERRESAVLDALVDLAIRRPDVALLLSRECLAAGASALCERDALIGGIERAMNAVPEAPGAIDLPPAVLVGGVLRFIAIRLANGPVTRAIAGEVRAWAHVFATPRRLRWTDRLLPAFPENAGDHRPAPQVSRSLSARERLLHATAAVILAKGYRTATVADIVAAAGVSRRSFYDHFVGKRDAFVECYELVFAQTIRASAPAFFSSSCWPERVWDSAHAFTGYFAAEPAFAHLGFVECYALGSTFLGRVLDTQLAFTFFLEEGYRQRPQTVALPRSFSTLTAATIFETGFLACRGGANLYMRSVQPLVVYMALAPFIGTEQAAHFVTRKLGGE